MMSDARKTVLITGAAKRIGKIIAYYFSNNTWDVAVHYHSNADEAEEVASNIRRNGQKAAIFYADFTKESEVASLIQRINEQLSPVTCLVNNASYFKNDGFSSNTRVLWDAHMEVNLRAPMVLMQSFVNQLPAAEQGNIINILDYCVWSLPEKFLSYTVSKSALWTITQMLAVQLAPSIRVNAIGPGPALANDRQTETGFSSSWQDSPLKRGSSPEEICRVIDFILNTPSMTGQMIALDGGRHLQRAEYK